MIVDVVVGTIHLVVRLKFIPNKLAGASSAENLYKTWSRCGGKPRSNHTSDKKYTFKRKHRKLHINRSTASLYRGTIEKGSQLWKQC